MTEVWKTLLEGIGFVCGYPVNEKIGIGIFTSLLHKAVVLGHCFHLSVPHFPLLLNRNNDAT